MVSSGQRVQLYCIYTDLSFPLTVHSSWEKRLALLLNHALYCVIYEAGEMKCKHTMYEYVSSYKTSRMPMRFC